MACMLQYNSELRLCEFADHVVLIKYSLSQSGITHFSSRRSFAPGKTAASITFHARHLIINNKSLEAV